MIWTAPDNDDDAVVAGCRHKARRPSHDIQRILFSFVLPLPASNLDAERWILNAKCWILDAGHLIYEIIKD